MAVVGDSFQGHRAKRAVGVARVVTTGAAVDHVGAP